MIRLFYLIGVFLAAIALLFRPCPTGQGALDVLVLSGVVLLPFFFRRRPDGKQFLQDRSGLRTDTKSADPSLLSRFHPVQLLRLRSAFDGWALAVLGIFLLSFLFSNHWGMTQHAFRQVAGGILLYAVFSSIRLELDTLFDVVIGILWAGWLILFLGPVWKEILPWLWAALPYGDPTGVVFAGESTPVAGMTIGALALEAWLAANLLGPESRGRRLMALLVHTLLWGMWGAVDSLWLTFASLSAFLLTAAIYPKRAWWRLFVIVFLGLAAFASTSRWSPLPARLWEDVPIWQPPFGAPVFARDLEVAVQAFPMGNGAGCHPALVRTPPGTWTATPLPGGQQIAWLSELGFFGPLLTLGCLWLLVWSLRFISRSQWERLEPSRDPEAFQSIKESDFPLGPVYLPATLFGWIVCSVAVYPLDLYRSPLFWLYLGLWVGWLTVSRQEALSTDLIRKSARYRSGVILAVTLLFILTAGTREAGRNAVRRAEKAVSPDRKSTLLHRAVRRDPLNPEPLFRLAETGLQQWRRTEVDLDVTRQIIRQGIVLASASPEGYRLLSRLEEAAGHLPAAIDAMEKAVARHPGNPSFHWRLAGLYESVGRTEPAGRQYRTLLHLDPANIEAHLGLARIAEKEGRLPDAREIYRRTLLLDRSHPSAQQRLKEIERLLPMDAQSTESP